MDKLKVTGKLKTYLEWPLTLMILWAVMVVVLFWRGNRQAALIAAVFAGIYFIFALILYLKSRPYLMNEMISFATNYGQVQKKILQEFALPYALLDTEGNFLWMNDEFIKLTGKDRHFHRNISALFPDAGREDLPGDDGWSECTIRKGNRIFRASFEKIFFDELGQDRDMFVDPAGQEYLIALCLFDDTDLTNLTDERNANQPVVGLLYLDNYDEAMEGVEDVRRSLLRALVERKIHRYFSDVEGVVRRLAGDRYIFVMRRKALEQCEAERFSLLDDVKTVNIGNEIALTVSMGVGVGSMSYLQNAEDAQSAIELALGRGGDQVVVKDGYRTRFFGGKSESTEKMTRVKARVKAHALKEIIDSRNRIVIMGHKLTDIDSLGAAIGLYRAAKTIGKPCHIVADDVSDSVLPTMELFRGDPEYSDDFFINRERAAALTGADTVLIVVDTNKASYTACEELLQMTNTIVVLDHHRIGDDRIQNAVLSYIEPYASSACEMVAEVLQYFDDSLKLRGVEADAMYAGIVIDTNNFVTRTGLRTFEAAAYLRKNGADITRVRKLFRDEWDDLRVKAETIARAEIFDGIYAISVCPGEGTHSPTVISAQAANELLDVVGIKASFVLTDYNGQIYISARAIDEVNVQLIMERLGGGGHLNIAGAQLPDYTIEEAMRLLRDTITEMREEGEI
ncbi:MAG: DHH family phosphoesterase [Lachnospiraceae bacterium]|nr:DHH family phosphoesterase [Lachnospiraceae bacterium]